MDILLWGWKYKLHQVYGINLIKLTSWLLHDRTKNIRLGAYYVGSNV